MYEKYKYFGIINNKDILKGTVNTDVNIFGQYDFKNLTYLNPLMDEKEQINTAFHEYTHFVLTNQNVYGMTQYILNKLFIPDDCMTDINKRKAIMNFLMNGTLKSSRRFSCFY